MREFEEELKNRNFEEYLEKLKKILKDKKVIFYGSGKFFREIIKNYDLSFINAIGICDIKYANYEEGKEDLGFKIIPWEKLKNYDADYILICTRFFVTPYKHLNLFLKDTKIKITTITKYRPNNIFQKIHKKITTFLQSKSVEFAQEKISGFLNKYIDITKLPAAKGKEREVQLKIFELLKELKQIFADNNLSYWLDAGTLLGAVRHKGFIPWDNDIDLCMDRQNFDRALEVLKEKYQDSDFYVREKAPVDNNYQIRIVNKVNTLVAIDIFPLDYYFKNNLSDEEKKCLTERIEKARIKLEKTHKSGYKTTKEIKATKEDLLKIRDEFILENKKAIEKGALFYALDFPYEYKESLCVDYETLYPLKEIEFEGDKFPCPNDTDKYLKNLYGNYMSFPPVSMLCNLQNE